MTATYWYDLLPDRLVLETIRVMSALGPGFLLKRFGGLLYWEGRAVEIPQDAEAPALHFLVIYPEAFPATPPWVEIMSPELDPSEWGHEWHRWWNGNVCYVRPSLWHASTTADEIIEKVKDWYFNYVAKKQGIIAKMPDVGRAALPGRRIEYLGGLK